MKKILFPTLTLIMTVAIAVSACADTTTQPDTSDGNDNNGLAIDTGHDTSDGNDNNELAIDTGHLTNRVGLKTSYYLNRSNGKYVNFYVENKGTYSVVATINDQSARTFAPDESGSISLEVTQGWFDRDREYEFKVVAGPGTPFGESEIIDIQYEMAQQDSQDS